MGFAVIIVSFLAGFGWFRLRTELPIEDVLMRAGLVCMGSTLLYFIVTVLIQRLG